MKQNQGEYVKCWHILHNYKPTQYANKHVYGLCFRMINIKMRLAVFEHQQINIIININQHCSNISLQQLWTRRETKTIQNFIEHLTVSKYASFIHSFMLPAMTIIAATLSLSLSLGFFLLVLLMKFHFISFFFVVCFIFSKSHPKRAHRQPSSYVRIERERKKNTQRIDKMFAVDDVDVKQKMFMMIHKTSYKMLTLQCSVFVVARARDCVRERTISTQQPIRCAQFEFFSVLT